MDKNELTKLLDVTIANLRDVKFPVGFFSIPKDEQLALIDSNWKLLDQAFEKIVLAEFTLSKMKQAGRIKAGIRTQIWLDLSGLVWQSSGANLPVLRNYFRAFHTIIHELPLCPSDSEVLTKPRRDLNSLETAVLVIKNELEKLLGELKDNLDQSLAS